VFGLFSKPPGAAEMLTDRTDGGALEIAALHPNAPMQEELRSERDAEMTTGSAVATAASAAAPKEAPATPVGRLERVPAFASYNLGSQFYPRFASAYFDRGVTPYRMRTSDRPLTDVTASRRA